MSKAELKAKLINEITNIDDEELLKEVYRLLEIGMDDSTPYVFNDEQIAMVNDTIQEVKSGNFLTEEEANNRTAKWLEETSSSWMVI